MKNIEQNKRQIKISGVPKLDLIPKKEFESLIALFELEIRDYYRKQQDLRKKFHPRKNF